MGKTQVSKEHMRVLRSIFVLYNNIMYSSQKYMCVDHFQTFGVFVRILSTDRTSYLSLYVYLVKLVEEHTK